LATSHRLANARVPFPADFQKLFKSLRLSTASSDQRAQLSGQRLSRVSHAYSAGGPFTQTAGHGRRQVSDDTVRQNKKTAGVSLNTICRKLFRLEVFENYFFRKN
jgi:hypothetical protein